MALKIKKINENCFLKDVIFSHDKRVVEFVYFITKLNKYYVENFRKNTTINEFTLYNIYTRKEYNIVIERVESGYFFEGLEYSVEFLPNFQKVLYVTDVRDKGPGYIKGVKKNRTILLGNEVKYFSGLQDVETEINSGNAKFIFYDYEENKINLVNFEEFRNKTNNELQIGVELQIRDVKEFNYEIKDDNNVKGIKKNNVKIHNEAHSSDGNDKLELQNKHKNIDLNAMAVNSENKIEDKTTDENQLRKCENELNIFNDNSVLIIDNIPKEIKSQNDKNCLNNDEINESIVMDTADNFRMIVNQEDKALNKPPILNILIDANNLQNEHDEYTNNEINIDDSREKLFEGEDEIDINNKLEKNYINETSQIAEDSPSIDNEDFQIRFKYKSIDKPKNNSLDHNVLGTDENRIDPKEADINLSTKNLNLLNTATSFDSCEFNNHTVISPGSIAKIKLDQIECTKTYYTKNCREKYKKKLSIYEKIDSHYNFMSINTILLSLKETANTTPGNTEMDTTSKYLNCKTQKKKILIKGFYLDKNSDKISKILPSNFKSLKILDLYKNTKTIDINN